MICIMFQITPCLAVMSVLLHYKTTEFVIVSKIIVTRLVLALFLLDAFNRFNTILHVWMNYNDILPIAYLKIQVIAKGFFRNNRI